MNLTLKVWRQKDAHRAQGRLRHLRGQRRLRRHVLPRNARRGQRGADRARARNRSRSIPIAAKASAARARWSSTAGARRPKGTTACQLHMRHFQDGETITIEPWRARAFPVLKDLITDRSAFDRIIQAGGFVSVNTGGAPDANALPVPKDRLPTGPWTRRPASAAAPAWPPARTPRPCCLSPPKFPISPSCRRARPRRSGACSTWCEQMDEEGFGNCTVTGSCEAVCPKEISLDFIAKMNREYGVALLKGEAQSRRRGNGLNKRVGCKFFHREKPPRSFPRGGLIFGRARMVSSRRRFAGRNAALPFMTQRWPVPRCFPRSQS